MAAKLRVTVCLNRAVDVRYPLVVAPNTEAILKGATNKLRIKKKDAAGAVAYVWKSGIQLPRADNNGSSSISLVGLVKNGDLIAICLGEPYAGPGQAMNPDSSCEGLAISTERALALDPQQDNKKGAKLPVLQSPPRMIGTDDVGTKYGSLVELWEEQAANYEDYYRANDVWWSDSGYGGSTDDEAMIGDGGSDEDIQHSLQFLGRHHTQFSSALDAGAGVGRVTKHALLRKCGHVTLVESCEHWSKQSRRNLGKKRAQRCSFVHARLEAYEPAEANHFFDLIWVQWCLQYLIDAHVVVALRNLGKSLTPQGIMIVKENRPKPKDDDDDVPMFAIDKPAGQHRRYDVTRPDEHHEWLFSCAGLKVIQREIWQETSVWMLVSETVGGRGAELVTPMLPATPRACLIE